MSAFVVEDEVINRVVTFFATARDFEWFRQIIVAETGCDLQTREGKENLGKAMFALNCNAVEQRYGEGQAKEFRELNYAFRLAPHANQISAYKSLKCWLYQCTEGDVPETSLLYASMKRLSGEWADTIVSRLPEYEAAKGW